MYHLKALALAVVMDMESALRTEFVNAKMDSPGLTAQLVSLSVQSYYFETR